MLKPDIRPLHFPPIFFTPLPFLAQRRNTLCLNADHFAPPPIPHPSYKVRIGKGRNLLISDSLENDPHGEILTPHHEFKPRKSCCSCFNSPPHSTHENQKDREKSVEKNAYFDAYYSNKICVHLALFFTDLRCRKCFKKSSK